MKMLQSNIIHDKILPKDTEQYRDVPKFQSMKGDSDFPRVDSAYYTLMTVILY